MDVRTHTHPHPHPHKQTDTHTNTHTHTHTHTHTDSVNVLFSMKDLSTHKKKLLLQSFTANIAIRHLLSEKISFSIQ